MNQDKNPKLEEILFVCSGNRLGDCTAAIRNQASALKKAGMNVSFFRVTGSGIPGYFRSVVQLKRQLKEHRYTVVHAHYGLSGMVASLAGAKPLVVSLMGSDVLGSWWLRSMVRWFAVYRWPRTIVKSEAMAEVLGKESIDVIPNGVDFSIFKPASRNESREIAGFNAPKHVLWPADPERGVKNINLARAAFRVLNRKDVDLSIIYGRPTAEMPVLYNASDVVLITSDWEGSPNVVKEALACNVPVVSTPVGDVEKWLLGVEGCFVCEAEPTAIAAGIKKALDFEGRTNGREKIGELSNESIVKKIELIYKAVKN